MDELDLLGSALGAVSGTGGLGSLAGGGGGASSGGTVNADTDINFGSGTIDSAPTIQQTPAAQTIEQPELSPVYTTGYAAATTAGTVNNPVSSTTSNNTWVWIGAGVLAIAGAYIILK